MDNPQVIEAIVAGDPAGLAAVYDRYAMPLYAYCRSMLSEPADAADAVQDTYLVASVGLRGLRDPAKLRPWLYAVARNECLRRLRAGMLTATLDEASDVPAETATVDPSARAERTELRALVRSAIDGLNPRDRDIVELSLRHDLDGDDLVDVLGVPRNHAHALLSRARSQLEKSLGALLVARSGRRDCPELELMLGRWDGRLTVLIRKRINRHIELCTVCDARKRRELSPALFAGLAPLSVALPGFRDQVLRAVAGHSSAGLVAANRAGPFGPSGFPPARSAPGALWRPMAGHTTAVATGTVTSVMAVGVLVVVGISGSHPGGPSRAAGPAHGAAVSSRHGASPRASRTRPGRSGRAVADPARATPGPSSVPGPLGVATSASRPGPPAPARRPTRAPAPTVAATAPTSPGALPTPAPTPTPTVVATAPTSPAPAPAAPSPGTLIVSPAVLDPVTVNGTPIGDLTLTAEGGPVSDYSVSVSSLRAGAVTVSPSSGSLAAGASVILTVTVTGRPVLGATITVNPGDHRILVLFGV